MEVTREKVAECCKMVRTGKCQEIFIVCDGEEEASELVIKVLSWTAKNEKDGRKPIKCVRTANEVKIFR